MNEELALFKSINCLQKAMGFSLSWESNENPLLLVFNIVFPHHESIKMQHPNFFSCPKYNGLCLRKYKGFLSLAILSNSPSTPR